MKDFEVGDKVVNLRDIDTSIDIISFVDKYIIGINGKTARYSKEDFMLWEEWFGKYGIVEEINLNPVGIEPKDIWLKKRKMELANAITRYTECELKIPNEWLVELIELNGGDTGE